MRPCIFLDRDGTIIEKAEEGAYVGDPREVRLLPGAARAIRRLNAASVPVFVVTNQRGIALGLVSEEAYASVTERMRALLAQAGAHLDGIYHCPHERDQCACRKPAAGMLLKAAEEHKSIDLQRAWLVGDADSDIDAARAAGVRAIKLGGPSKRATRLASSLEDAVDLLLESSLLLQPPDGGSVA